MSILGKARSAIDLKPSTRRRLYEVAIGLVGLAVAHGVIDGNEGRLWLLTLAAVLGVARANVPSLDQPKKKRGRFIP